MADSPAKRNREAKKRRKKQLKEERKARRKEGGEEEVDMSGYFPDGARPPQNAEDALRLKRLSEARERQKAKAAEDRERETGS